MGSSNKYSKLHNKVVQRDGAGERLRSLRAETLAEIEKFEHDHSPEQAGRLPKRSS